MIKVHEVHFALVLSTLGCSAESSTASTTDPLRRNRDAGSRTDVPPSATVEAGGPGGARSVASTHFAPPFAYGPDLVLEHSPASGDTRTKYQYDQQGRLTTVVSEDLSNNGAVIRGVRTEYSYDPSGRIMDTSHGVALGPNRW